MQKEVLLEKIIIYYFSGTGNALNVAKWIKKISKNRNVETDIIDISKLEKRRVPSHSENTIIGFCSPTHGFNFPPIMFHFILRFVRSNNNRAFLINTRAGMKAGNIFLPGLSGMSQIFSALILKIKKYKIIGMHPIDLPSNWISIHPGLKSKVIESIYKKRKEQVERFTNKILDGKSDYRALRDIIQDIAIFPISVVYYCIGRFFLAKSFIASNDCNNCNLCLNKCPVNAIKLVNNKPFWTYKCESCMKCMNNCKQRAIETPHGYIIALIIIVNYLMIYGIYHLFNIENLLQKYFTESLVVVFEFTLNTLIFFLCLFISYRLIHFLMRFKPFERVIVYSSLTKFKFWRRYKLPKNIE